MIWAHDVCTSYKFWQCFHHLISSYNYTIKNWKKNPHTDRTQWKPMMLWGSPFISANHVMSVLHTNHGALPKTTRVFARSGEEHLAIALITSNSRPWAASYPSRCLSGGDIGYRISSLTFQWIEVRMAYSTFMTWYLEETPGWRCWSLEKKDSYVRRSPSPKQLIFERNKHLSKLIM